MSKFKSEQEINDFIKLEVDAQRDELASNIESKLRRELDNRVAEQVRLALQSLTTRAAGDARAQVVVQAVRQNACKEPPRYNGAEVGEAGAAWIRAVDEHLRQLKLDDPSLSDEKLVAIAVSFTCDAAREFSVEIRNELGSAATWNGLQVELMSRFGVRKSSWNLLQDLREVKQARANVATYTNIFESRLAYLVGAGFTDSLSAVSYYIEGLNRDMRSIVARSFLTLSDDPMESYKAMRPRQAVRAIAKLASRCEEVEVLLCSKLPGDARAAVVVADDEHCEPRAAVAQAKSGSGRQTSGRHANRGRGDRKEPSFTRDDLINHLASKHGVSRVLVDQRLKANLCAACAGEDHTARTCANPPVREAPGPAGSPQPTNARAH